MNKYVKIFEVAFYAFMFIAMISLIAGKPIISRHYSIPFIGFVFVSIGLLGLYKKQVLLTRSRPLNYEKSSAWMIFNITFCVAGFFLMLIWLLGLDV